MKRTISAVLVVLTSVAFISWLPPEPESATASSQMQYVDVLRALIGKECVPLTGEGGHKLRFYANAGYKLVRVGADHVEVANAKYTVFLPLSSFRTTVCK